MILLDSLIAISKSKTPFARRPAITLSHQNGALSLSHFASRGRAYAALLRHVRQPIRDIYLYLYLYLYIYT